MDTWAPEWRDITVRLDQGDSRFPAVFGAPICIRISTRQDRGVQREALIRTHGSGMFAVSAAQDVPPVALSSGVTPEAAVQFHADASVHINQATEWFGDHGRLTIMCATLDEASRIQAFDAIVSLDDTTLAMEDGAPAAILRLGGPNLREEVKRLAPLPIGEIGVTSGGEGRARYILHAAVADRANSITPTERTIRQITKQLLTRCEALAIKRLAIPLVTHTDIPISLAVFANVIRDVVKVHARLPSVIEAVVTIIPDVGAFRDVVGLPTYGAPRRTASAPIRRNTDDSTATAAPVSPADLSHVGASDGRLRPGDSRITLPEVPTEILFGGFRQALARWIFPDAANREAQSPPTPHSATQEPSPRILTHRYVLLEQLGRGGFGVVHLAWDLVLRRTVAIKTMREEFASSSVLYTEAAIALDLTHDSIVRAYHFEPRVEEGGPYLVMEYLSWVTAEKWLADAGECLLPVKAVLEVGRRLCTALSYAHERGVLHLDIKPGNVFVDAAGERAKLSDFGTARLAAGPGRAALQSIPVGTPAYMAPEQWAAGARLTPATDVYQLAATLWDLLTGQPYQPSRPTPATDHARSRTLTLVQRALASEPSDRPRNAESFLNLLDSEVVTG
jgi:O-acetyl-ADP-ribose deacetylase (regulator of RNase III)